MCVYIQQKYIYIYINIFQEVEDEEEDEGKTNKMQEMKCL